jgi:F-type H+-transporting ATPase subunit b
MTFLSQMQSATYLLASGEEPNPLKFEADLALVTIVVFVGRVLVQGKFAWKPLIAALDQRDKSIADDIEAARQANTNAQSMLQQYEAKLEHAKEEVNQLLAQAKNDASAAKQKILDEAGLEAQRQRDRAVAEIEAAKDNAIRALAEKSVDSAVLLAGNLVGRELNSDSHKKLIEDSLDRFVSKN